MKMNLVDIVDETLINIDRIKEIIDKEFEIGSGKGLAEQAYYGDETNLDNDDIGTSGTPAEKDDKNGEKAEDTNANGKKESETDIKVFVKKCRSYYRRILFYAFLCKSEKEIKNLTEIIESIESSENKRIFDHLGMDTDFILLMQKKMSGIAKRSLDDKIYDLYRLSHEYEQDDVDPIRRATTAIQKFGKISDSEVVTPQKTAKEMVDLIPETDFIAVFDNGYKFLDIASKMGEFAVAIYRRAESLGIPKEKICNSIYSIPTSNLAYEFTRFVYEKLGLNTDNLAEQFNSYDLLKIKKKIKRGKNAGKDTKENDYEKICAILSQNKPFSEITIDDEITEGDEKVSFDVVIGNPPYQDQSMGDNKNFAPPIYDKFMDFAYSFCDIAVLIHPAKFLFNAGKTPKEWNKKMLNDHHFRVEKYVSDVKKVFSDTSFTGGIAISMHNNAKDYGAIEFFTAFSELDSINNKVHLMKQTQSLSDIIYTQCRYNLDVLFSKSSAYKSIIGSEGQDKRFRNNAFDKLDVFTKKAIYTDDIKVIGISKNKREWRYINKCLIETNHPNLFKWKVLVPRANGSGAIGETIPTPLIGEPLLANPQIGYTQSFIGIGAFSSEAEAEALFKYIKTKFARTMLGMLKVTQDNDREMWRLVPLQDFTNNSDIDWSKAVPEIDEQLYDKYGLTTEERAFIESTIKPME